MSSPHTHNRDNAATAHHLVTSAASLLHQPPPPSLREIVEAYRTRPGSDDDRELLLAILSAKTAEDQRIASVASLQRSALEMCKSPTTPEYQEPQPTHPNLRRKHCQEQELPYKRCKTSPPPDLATYQLPPSPKSSPPRSPRTSMAIDSLLSPHPH